MPIKNETVYNRSLMWRFIVFNACKTKKLRMILALIAGVFALGFSVFGILQNGGSSVYSAFAVAILALFAALNFRWFVAPYLQYRRVTGGKDITLSYEFYSRDFVARSVRDHAKRDSGVRYSALESVYERRDYLYLYPSPAQAFIVDKTLFAPEDWQKFCAMLRREVDDHRLHLKKKK